MTFLLRSMRPRSALLGLTLAALILGLLLVPPEASLGDLIRVVYLHGALLRAGEAAFAAAGFAGVLYLLTRREGLASWSWAFLKTAALVWCASFAVSTWVTVAAWGSVNWSEPRFLASGQVLAATATALALGLMVERPQVKAALGIGTSLFVAVQLSTAGLMLHPDNPIGASSSAGLRAHYLVVAALAVLLALEIAWSLWRGASPAERSQDHQPL